jgi:hypothetical protein
MVSWLAPTRVSVEVGLPHLEPPVWLTRELTFAEGDPALERWRAVGFTIALLVDDERFWASLPAGSLLEEPVVDEEPAPGGGAEQLGFDAELRGFAGAGLVSGPWRMGAELRGSVLFSGPWLATAGVEYALAEAETEGLDVRWLDLSLGLGLRDEALFDGVEGRLRLEFVAENVAVTAREGLSTDRRNAWVPGVVLGGDLHWRVVGPWALSVRADAFWLDGSTAITSGGERVAASAGAGVLFGVGGRYRF